MSDQENDALRKRLAELQGEKADGPVQSKPKPSAGKMTLMLGGAAVLAGAVYVYSQPEGEGDLPIEIDHRVGRAGHLRDADADGSARRVGAARRHGVNHKL